MSDFDPRFDPAFQRGFDGPTRTASQQSDDAAPDSPPLVRIDPEAAAPTDTELEDLPARRGNPFLIALTALAAALTVGGLALVFQLRTIFGDGTANSDFDYITLQTLTIGAPILVGLGVATGIGVLFVLAARWGR